MSASAFPEYGRWDGQTVACLASGPSLTPEDAELCRAAGLRTIVVNTTFRLAPWADVLYSNDEDWFEHHLPEVLGCFSGEKWCGHPSWRHPSVRSIPYDKTALGLITDPGRIAWGMNSGAAAMNLALQFGAARILMLGFDQGLGPTGERRWHGRHPEALQNQVPGFGRWRSWFEQAALDFAALGVEVVNCSRRTSLDCFPRKTICEALL